MCVSEFLPPSRSSRRSGLARRTRRSRWATTCLRVTANSAGRPAAASASPRTELDAVGGNWTAIRLAFLGRAVLCRGPSLRPVLFLLAAAARGRWLPLARCRWLGRGAAAVARRGGRLSPGRGRPGSGRPGSGRAVPRPSFSLYHARLCTAAGFTCGAVCVHRACCRG